MIQEVQIPVDEVKPFLDRQSRKDDFEQLKDSIRQYGVLVRIQVTPIKEKKRGKARKRGRGKDWKYQLVWGHRRLRAAKEVGLETVPAEIVAVDNKERVKRFFIENEARKQLTAYEVAQLMESDRGLLSINEIAEKYSIKIKTVRGILRALEHATPALRKHLGNGRFSLDDALAITQLTNMREQVLIINRAIEKGLKGRSLKQEVRSIRKIDNISTRAVQARQRALNDELRTMGEERETVTKNYDNSVLALQDALVLPEVRRLMDKTSVDYSAFWNK